MVRTAIFRRMMGVIFLSALFSSFDTRAGGNGVSFVPLSPKLQIDYWCFKQEWCGPRSVFDDYEWEVAQVSSPVSRESNSDDTSRCTVLCCLCRSLCDICTLLCCKVPCMACNCCDEPSHEGE